ncbi:MAG: DNA processing protein [Luteibaculaceae bacterium]
MEKVNWWQHGIQHCKGVGPRTLRKWLGVVSIQELFEDKPHSLFAKLGHGSTLRTWIKERQHCEVVGESNFKERLGNSTWFQDSDFPWRLNECPDAPLLLHYQGEPNWNGPKMCAVVGTRTPDDEGRRLTEQLVAYLGNLDCGIISGMAYGIDFEAHQVSNKLDVPNFGVLGSGLGKFYPSKHQNEAQRTQKHGAIISEFLPYTKPDRENFPQRNRIIAGMADLCIVVQSKAKGGALITAELAGDYNREVGVFPGNIFNENFHGNNRFIYESKAFCIHQLDTIAHQMGWKNEGQQLSLHWAKPEFPDRFLYLEKHLSKEAISIETLAINCQKEIHSIKNDLFFLELEGLIQLLPGNQVKLV